MSELKTAETVLKEHTICSQYCQPDYIEAMQAYALQVAEAVRDECAKRWLLGLNEFGISNRKKDINLTQFIK